MASKISLIDSLRLEDFNGGHPFYNIKRIKDDKYVLEMALAGYKKSEVKVEVTDGVLSLRGETRDEKEDYVHKGIARRAFAKQLQLSEYVECTGAKLRRRNVESGFGIQSA